MSESKDVMQKFSDSRQNAGQKRMPQAHFLTSIIDETLHALRDLTEKGSRGFDCTEHSLSVLSSWKRATDGRRRPTDDRRRTTDGGYQPTADFQPAAEKAFEPPVLAGRFPSESAALSAPISEDSLESIITDMGDCRRCKLSRTRTHVVFGAGSPTAVLMFVGEAPGFDEDQQGMPFVGKAGQLLTRIIQAINLTRDQVYICNVIKCRPPGNRNPEPDEIIACSPFLNRQIASIQPEFICALGTFAAQTLLKTTQPISRLRGQFYDYNGIRLLPTFHPSYLLRNPDKKREVWEDMKLLMNEMTP
jgi:uracil-DNA glycosylase